MRAIGYSALHFRRIEVLKKVGVLMLVAALCVSLGQMALAKTGAASRMPYDCADSHYNQGLLYLDKLLKERTNGEIELEIYHSAQLGSEREPWKGWPCERLEMTLISSAPLAI